MNMDRIVGPKGWLVKRVECDEDSGKWYVHLRARGGKHSAEFYGPSRESKAKAIRAHNAAMMQMAKAVHESAVVGPSCEKK